MFTQQTIDLSQKKRKTKFFKSHDPYQNHENSYESFLLRLEKANNCKGTLIKLNNGYLHLFQHS